MFTEVEVAAMLTDIGTVREVNQIGQTARVHHHHLQSLQKRDLTPPESTTTFNHYRRET